MLYRTTYGEGTLPFVMDNIRCTGSESALTECAYLGAGEIRSCSVFEDAGVRCRPCEFSTNKYIYTEFFVTYVFI